MKSVSLWIRRLHLYMTLFCLPWFVMYGITALAFSHPKWFSVEDDLYNLNSQNWREVNSWNYDLEIPESDPIPKTIGRELLQVAELPVKAFSVGRWGSDSIAVYISDVWRIRRLMYDIPNRKLALYHHTPDLRVFLTGLHARAGYHHDSLTHDAWAVMVDMVALGILLWVASGLFIWWQQRRQRRVGLLGLGLGIAAFVAFLYLL